MGWFSNAVSWVANKAVSVASSVVRAGKKAAASAVNWLADKAETFIGDVQKIYKTVQPFISKMRVGIRVLAKLAPWPWVQVMAKGVDLALATLENLGSHPLMEKVKKGCEWLITAAREIQKRWLNEAEIEEAEQRAADLEAALHVLPAAQQAPVQAAALLNNYLLVKAKIAQLIDSSAFVDFEHYLRIRAVQKLLQVYEDQMVGITDIASVNEEPRFIIDIARELLSVNPDLDEASAIRLDAIASKNFGKSLIPFIFEELVVAWDIELETLEAEWEVQRAALAKDRVLARRLTLSQEIEPLNDAESVMLANLNITLPRDSEKFKDLELDALHKSYYIFAAEGFLQLLEKDEASLQDGGQEFLAEQGSEVGKLIIECAQNGRKWDTLTEDQQSLIIDFANIFEDACRARTEKFREVEVSA